MRTSFKAALWLTVAATAVAVAGGASAQSYGPRYAAPYGYGRADTPPPPPPPAPGQRFRPDRGYDDEGYGGLNDVRNSDGSYGPQNYVSQPDTVPSDPGRLAYDADRARRDVESRYDRGYGDRYEDGYAEPRYRRDRRDWDGDDYAPPPPRPYGYGNSAPPARYEDGYAYPARRY